MTIACLLANTLLAARLSAGLSRPERYFAPHGFEANDD
jgi:hypothetical protein